MARIGVLGLEPFLVSQVEQLDRRSEVVLLDPLADEDRDAAEVDVVLVSRDHAAVGRLLHTHPTPPVVVVDDGGPGEDLVADKGEPQYLHRPVSSPELREAIDRSLGVPAWRRAFRSITIEQDDAAGPDRWLGVLRTLVGLGVLAWGAWNVEAIGVLPLVVLTTWILVRASWWRLTPRLVLVDVLVVAAGLAAWGGADATPPVEIAILASTIAGQAGFLWGWWRSLAGTVVLVAVELTVWYQFFGRRLDELASDAAIVTLLVVTAAAAGAMGRRLWADHSQSRSSELRRFRSSLYELSRRQAVVAVSFDLGTVAEDALSRVLADVKPRAAMVLVADGPGPLQVGASHNLTNPPPVRLTWQPGLGEGTGAERPTPAPPPAPSPREDLQPVHGPDADQAPDWRPSRLRVAEQAASEPDDDAGRVADPGTSPGDAPSDDAVLAQFPDIDPGADLVGPGDESDGGSGDPPGQSGQSGEVDARTDPPDQPDQAPPPAWASLASSGSDGVLARRLAARMSETRAATGHDHQGTAPAEAPPANPPTRPVEPDGHGVGDPTLRGVDAGADLAPPRPTVPPAAARAEHAVEVLDEPATADAKEGRAREQEDLAAGPLLDRTTIHGAHGSRLREVMAQLGESLPTGPVLVESCELDGELMGALVVVGAREQASVAQHAEETALALDSVRLFNRLRAFTRDQERARIARSLHDGVMQTLAHVAFELDRVSRDSWDESQVDTLGRLRDHVLGTVDEMRTVVNDLRTVRLDRGLPAALEAIALTLSPAGGPVIEVQAGQVGQQAGDVEEQFLRVAEEALNNAVVHSGARRVVVRLEERDGALLLQVLDDGFGFSRARVGEEDGGVGLTSMYQRARSIGAGLDIDTGANGTIVTLHHASVPRRAPEPADQDEDATFVDETPRRWWRRST